VRTRRGEALWGRAFDAAAIALTGVRWVSVIVSGVVAGAFMVAVAVALLGVALFGLVDAYKNVQKTTPTEILLVVLIGLVYWLIQEVREQKRKPEVYVEKPAKGLFGQWLEDVAAVGCVVAMVGGFLGIAIGLAWIGGLLIGR
jgi:hypothetical protein